MTISTFVGFVVVVSALWGTFSLYDMVSLVIEAERCARRRLQ